MTPAFNWIEDFLRGLEAGGIPAVYLRNHENLPHDIGNDVDLLIAKGTLQQAATLAASCAAQHGWRHLRSVEFGPLSMFFVDSNDTSFIHIDLFTRIEWHWLPFADPDRILARRRWNGHVFIPDPLDEVFLNVATRLFYQGLVREKHRAQAERILTQEGTGRLRGLIEEHLGIWAAQDMTPLVIQRQWHDLEARMFKWRNQLLIHSMGTKPLQSLAAALQYLQRGVRRILHPPGPFIVIEGADGTCKSTLIEGLVPLFKELTGRSDTLLFQWKPIRQSMPQAGEAKAASNHPRPNLSRTFPTSFLFLARSWSGFWLSYLLHIHPARVKNRAVIADHDIQNFFLNSADQNLRIPVWLVRLAATTTPHSDLVILLGPSPIPIETIKFEQSSRMPSNKHAQVCEIYSSTNGTSAIVDTDDDLPIMVSVTRRIIDLMSLNTNG
jgi:hypothetical protein